MNNVKMRSKNTKGETVEVIDKSVRIPTMDGYKVRSKFQVLVNNYQLEVTETFTEAKNIFKWALTQ